MAIRPKRIVDETCWNCKRPGYVHDQPYTLLTADEHRAVFPASENWRQLIVEGLPAGYEPMWVGAGGEINGSIEEAIAYCKDYGITGVGFLFNDKLLLVTAESGREQLYRQWWQERYNETPEESRARR